MPGGAWIWRQPIVVDALRVAIFTVLASIKWPKAYKNACQVKEKRKIARNPTSFADKASASGEKSIKTTLLRLGFSRHS
jgi:hypothetical protein